MSHVEEPQQREALIALYGATNGEQWTQRGGWKTSQPLEQWHGVTVDNGSVVKLDLSRNGLEGSIPGELGSLEKLEGLSLGDNNLTGTSPPELGRLTNLVELCLSYNNLSGRIPPQLGHLSNLRELVLWGNRLEGSIPPALESLKKLEQLDLSFNRLTGSIPPELGSLENLTVLSLWGNKLTGSIPPELGGLRNLEKLSLNNNKLTGSIPPEFGRLKNLQTLNLYNNKLTGNIPPELGSLENLTHLYLYNNKLTGRIPPELGCLQNLKRLYLDENKLTGNIPPQLGELSNLRELQLNKNSLEGSIPRELGSFENLIVLSLRHNNLTGLWDPSCEEVEGLIAFAARHGTTGGFDGNPFDFPPLGVAKQGSAALENYYESVLEGRGVYNTIKVVLLGASGAGKTSLLRSLQCRRAALTTGANPSTTGVEMVSWEATGPRDEPITMRFFDCGGQILYRSLYSFFCPDGATYLLLWRAREFCESGGEEGFDNRMRLDVEPFVETLRYQSVATGPSRLVLVGSKCDKVPVWGRVPRVLEQADRIRKRVVGILTISLENEEGEEEEEEAHGRARAGRERFLDAMRSLPSYPVSCAPWYKNVLGILSEGWSRFDPSGALLEELYAKGCRKFVVGVPWQAALIMLETLSLRGTTDEVLCNTVIKALSSSSTAPQESRPSVPYIMTMGELRARWDGLCDTLRGKEQELGVDKASLFEGDSATLQGVLHCVVRMMIHNAVLIVVGDIEHDRTLIVLDSAWFARIVSPLLTPLDKMIITGRGNAQRIVVGEVTPQEQVRGGVQEHMDDFKGALDLLNGELTEEFAKSLWDGVLVKWGRAAEDMGIHVLEKSDVRAILEKLEDLGILFPVESLEDGGRHYQITLRIPDESIPGGEGCRQREQAVEWAKAFKRWELRVTLEWKHHPPSWKIGSLVSALVKAKLGDTFLRWKTGAWLAPVRAYTGSPFRAYVNYDVGERKLILASFGDPKVALGNGSVAASALGFMLGTTREVLRDVAHECGGCRLTCPFCSLETVLLWEDSWPRFSRDKKTLGSLNPKGFGCSGSCHHHKEDSWMALGNANIQVDRMFEAPELENAQSSSETAFEGVWKNQLVEENKEEERQKEERCNHWKRCKQWAKRVKTPFDDAFSPVPSRRLDRIQSSRQDVDGRSQASPPGSWGRWYTWYTSKPWQRCYSHRGEAYNAASFTAILGPVLGEILSSVVALLGGSFKYTPLVGCVIALVVLVVLWGGRMLYVRRRSSKSKEQ